MRILYLLLSLLVFTSSCVTKYKGHKLSVFTINSHTRNGKIINRFPDYGDGHRDGCIIMSEMHIDLNIHKEGMVSGLIRDVNTTIPLTQASVKLLSNSGKEITLLSDEEGKFVVTLDGLLSRLQVDYLAYRRFVVQL